MTPHPHPDPEPAPLRPAGLGPAVPPAVRRRRPDDRGAGPGARGPPARRVWLAEGPLARTVLRVARVRGRAVDRDGCDRPGRSLRDRSSAGGARRPGRRHATEPGGRSPRGRAGGYTRPVARAARPDDRPRAPLGDRPARLRPRRPHRRRRPARPATSPRCSPASRSPPNGRSSSSSPAWPKASTARRKPAPSRELPPIAERLSDRLCRLVLLGLLPAVAEHDLEAFGAALTELQEHVGRASPPPRAGPTPAPSSRRSSRTSRPRACTAWGKAPGGRHSTRSAGTRPTGGRPSSGACRARFGLGGRSASWTVANATGAVLEGANDDDPPLA